MFQGEFSPNIERKTPLGLWILCVYSVHKAWESGMGIILSQQNHKKKSAKNNSRSAKNNLESANHNFKSEDHNFKFANHKSKLAHITNYSVYSMHYV